MTPDAEPPSEEPKGPPPRRTPGAGLDFMRAAGQLGAVGLSFALALIIGALIGLWLDRVTGWSPLFFILFFIAGFAAGVVNVTRMTRGLK